MCIRDRLDKAIAALGATLADTLAAGAGTTVGTARTACCGRSGVGHGHQRITAIPGLGAGESRDGLIRGSVRQAGRGAISAAPATGRSTLTARTDCHPVDTGVQVTNRGDRDCAATAAAAGAATALGVAALGVAAGTAAAASAAGARERNFIVAFNQLRAGQVRNSAAP